MKKFLLIVIIFFTVFVNAAKAQSIISCNSTGYEINTFYTNETVYVKSTTNITINATEVDIYIVNDNNTWTNGTILTDVSGGKKTNTTNATGYLELTRIWSPTLTVGKYDIVVDVDRNAVYNSSIDYVDSLTATGFEVIPVPVPTLALALGPNSPSSHSWNLGNTSYNTMLQLKLTAGSVEDVKITSIALSASGTGNDKTGVHFASLVLDNGNGVYDQGETLLSYGQYNRDDGVLMFNIDNYVIPINQTVYMLIVYTMTNSSSNGDTYSFQVASVTAVGADTGEQVRITGLPITSATKTIVAAVTTTTTTTSTTTTTTSTTTTTTTTLPTTTTSIQLPQLGKNWIYVVLAVGLIPVAIVAIALAILFFKKRRQQPENKFEELKEKWKK
jgi:hypothetical protein